MPYPAHVSDTAYYYDGSFTGFLCCVFESYTRREIPSAVLGPGEGQTTLFGLKSIPTDPAHAKRVADGLTRLGPMVKERVMIGFLSTEEEKDLILLRFVRCCFDKGPRAVQMLGDPDVSAAFALERSIRNEACHFTELLRFEERDGRLMMPLSITCHHAAADGWHVQRFLEAWQAGADGIGEFCAR